MSYDGKYSLAKSLFSEANLAVGQVFRKNLRKSERMRRIFKRKMEESEDGNTFPFKLDPDGEGRYGSLEAFTQLRIPKSQNMELYTALENDDKEAFRDAYRQNKIKAFTEDGTQLEITTPGHLYKNVGEGGFGGGSGAQAIGTQYEEDAAAYFKSILQKNLDAELQGGSAGASDIGSDNEYYLGTSRDDIVGGTNLLKMEIKTSAGARFGQMQWGFTVDDKNLPTEFQFRGSKKAEQGVVNQPIADYLNNPSRLNALRQELEADILSADPNWAEEDLYRMRGGLIGGFKKSGTALSVPAKKIQEYWISGFAATKDQVANDVPNIGYNYYKAKGDQFIIVGKLTRTKPGGIFSLDQEETEELAKALGIPSFREAGKTQIQASYPLERMINMPSLQFGDVDPIPFPADSNAIKAALDSPIEGLRRSAVGFALYIQGSLDGLSAGAINSAIDAAIAVLDAPDTEAVEDVIDDTVLTKQDVMGNTEIAEDAPGTQQNNSRQYNNLPKLFEWAVK